MRIVLNSDIVHTNRLFATGLPKHLEEFCREAAQAGGILVLPRTVLLEDERHQETLYRQTLTDIENARETLALWRITVPEFRPEDVVHRVDLLSALRHAGVSVEVEDATLDDYRDAERRASLHLAPQAPDSKSDEMRDLVIWAVALRVAVRHNGAMLVSRDSIHSGESGTEEAANARLFRARSIDDALDQLGRVNEAAALARSVFVKVWEALREEGIPLPDDVPVRRFPRLQFSVDQQGYVATQLSFEFATRDGKLSGDANICQSTPSSIRAVLTGLTIEGRPWRTGTLELSVGGELPKFTHSAAERMAELRHVIEGKQ